MNSSVPVSIILRKDKHKGTAQSVRIKEKRKHELIKFHPCTQEIVRSSSVKDKQARSCSATNLFERLLTAEAGFRVPDGRILTNAPLSALDDEAEEENEC